jgi:hypothetical protein
MPISNQRYVFAFPTTWASIRSGPEWSNRPKLSDLRRVCNHPEFDSGQSFVEVDGLQFIENAKNVFQMRGLPGFAFM